MGSSENETLRPQVHKSCRALAVGLVKCLKDTPCVKDEKRSYKECALHPDVVTSSKCGDLRDTYLKCKREQVGLVVWERVSQNPEGLFRA